MARPPAVIGRAPLPLTPRTLLRGLFRAPGPHSDAVLALPLWQLLSLAAAFLLLPSLSRWLTYDVSPLYTYPVALAQFLLLALLLAAGSGRRMPLSLAARILAASTPCLLVAAVPHLRWVAAGWQLWLIVTRLRHYGALTWRHAAWLTVSAYFVSAGAALLVLMVQLPEIPAALRGPFDPLFAPLRALVR